MIAIPDVPPGSRLRTPAGETWLLLVDGRWVREVRAPAARAGLAAAVRAAIESEPGRWSVPTLADDHGVSDRAIRYALERVEHSRRLHVADGRRMWLLYPPATDTVEQHARRLLALGPMSASRLARALRVDHGPRLDRVLAAVGARHSGRGPASRWSLA